MDFGGAVGGFGVLGSGKGGGFGGLLLRPRLVETDRFILGVEAQGGWAWASLGLPMSVRVHDKAWVYTDPSLGFRYTGALYVPAGVSVELGERWRLNTDLTYIALLELADLGYLYGDFVIGSVGVSYRP